MNRNEYRDKHWKFPFVEYVWQVSEKKLPLIIQLHGAGERGDGREDLKYVDVHGFSKVIKDDELHECRIVMPQCPKDTFWAAHVESILEFIEQLKKEFAVDEKRIYLTGLSMGGYGTWYTAMSRPDIFAAVVPICGGGMAWNAKVLTMPVWVFHGTDDATVSVVQSDEMVQSMRNNGLDVTYTRLDGVGHNSWEHAYSIELLEWMLSKTT